ncbi:AMP-binding protein [Streptomyces sp. NPDC050164]|uniref:AMP-binding protein n=1 Tax=Streptomyces sp. NPDC050164 TaxID=3365605 RepID=UPI00379D0484
MRREELVRPVPELLRQHAEVAGERVAHSDSSRSVTYAELERRTRSLAAYLTGTGLRRGDRVAIRLGNCVEMVESCLAVLRAGMVGVPLNPRSSDAELAHFLRDSGAAFVITDAAHLAQLRRLGPPQDRLGVLVTGTGPVPDGARLFRSAAESDGAAQIDMLGLDDPAWILYTSGTTHRPKGVLSTQRAALWSVAACYAPIFGLSPDDPRDVVRPAPHQRGRSCTPTARAATARGAPGLPSHRLRRGLQHPDHVDTGLPTGPGEDRRGRHRRLRSLVVAPAPPRPDSAFPPLRLTPFVPRRDHRVALPASVFRCGHGVRTG